MDVRAFCLLAQNLFVDGKTMASKRAVVSTGTLVAVLVVGNFPGIFRCRSWPYWLVRLALPLDCSR